MTHSTKRVLALELTACAMSSVGTTALSTNLRETLIDWSRAEAPREACGILLGCFLQERIEVFQVVLAPNLSPGIARFSLDPGQVVAAERAARESGWELVGFWHSHPRDVAVPSAEDVRHAWAGHVHVIVGLRGLPAVRAWRLRHGELVEDTLL